MTVRNGLFSSESVSEGHPDKLADRISDAVLDEFLRHEPTARVACETLLADQCVVVAGEFKTRDSEAFRTVRERAVAIVTKVLRDAGYRDSATAGIIEFLDLQRPIYYPTAAYGHFGRDDLGLPWENVRSAANIETGASQ